MLILCFQKTYAQQDFSNDVDPLIGSMGEGNIFLGPTLPFGMIKPGPDCSLNSNSGYVAPSKNSGMFGISHTHVSGTGGGPKYGNILVCPQLSSNLSSDYKLYRQNESVSVGYYSTELENKNILLELTATHSVAFHKFKFKNSEKSFVRFDLNHHLGKGNGKESQYLVGSELEVMSQTELRGYTRVRGGWNQGETYSVFFYAVFDVPFDSVYAGKDAKKIDFDFKSSGNTISDGSAAFGFKNNSEVKLKVAISYVSSAKAKQNLERELPEWNFEQVVLDARKKWSDLLGCIDIDESNLNKRKIFYTSLYHSCLIPSDRTGENPVFESNTAYYDDFYAIWDTYRTVFPLLTIIAPSRVTGMINSLLGSYKIFGFLPDASSGNSIGLTQGGSNADVVIADAFVKDIKGVDYNLALKAMIDGSENDPGYFHRFLGRGGVGEYNNNGYVSYSHERHCTRTVEYALCDYSIYQVAKGLGKKSVAEKYLQRSSNWKNIWRDTVINNTKGFIWPKTIDGKWVDSTYQTYWSNVKSKFEKEKRIFTPNSFGWGWDDVFYEGNSNQYSLHIMHDIPALIEKCGGPFSFENRLDTFFAKNYYDVTNEPCFFTPVLYHFIGKPNKSNLIIDQIINSKFTHQKDGIPGNDDSGAMSSWFAFHAMGLYPNAGQNYYLLTSPKYKSISIKLENGNKFIVNTKNFDANNKYVKKVILNGKVFNSITITHQEIMKGGVLTFEMSSTETDWGNR